MYILAWFEIEHIISQPFGFRSVDFSLTIWTICMYKSYMIIGIQYQLQEHLYVSINS